MRRDEAEVTGLVSVTKLGRRRRNEGDKVSRKVVRPESTTSESESEVDDFAGGFDGNLGGFDGDLSAFFSEPQDASGPPSSRAVETDVKVTKPSLPPPERQRKARPATYVEVQRTEEVERQRAQLPIYMEEQRVMEALLEHDVVVICGATGSGKTTQVPQFLYEAGFGSARADRGGMIGVTEPRRVAATAMARRVRHEMNLTDRTVAHQVRYDSRVGPETRIKFMTDGVLMREVQSDFLLRRYSVILLDEAHERRLNTDILIGLLSRIVRLRRALYEKRADANDTEGTPVDAASDLGDVFPLRLVVMSATLRVDDFAANRQLFDPPPPVVSVEARQFPVSVHFSRTTPDDYVEATRHKTVRVHRELPPGGILVFLATRREIEAVCAQLREDLDENEVEVLPLYSTLAPERQARVFAPPGEGKRLVVVATNVAETSITIPGVVYVVDSGMEKRKVWDEGAGLSRYEIVRCSKAAAEQRAGRAGRTAPGHCYRLFSSALFDAGMDEFAPPEIAMMPIEGVVLQMKSMGIAHVARFPFPTPPSDASLRRALEHLADLGALDADSRITELGRAMAWLPVAPRFAKMIVLAHRRRVLPHVLSIVAALSHQSPLVTNDAEFVAAFGSTGALQRGAASRAHKPFVDDRSDALTLLRAVGAYDHARDPDGFCVKFLLNPRIMREILQLRAQLADVLARTLLADDPGEMFPLRRSTASEELQLRQIIAAGFVDQVARVDASARGTDLYIYTTAHEEAESAALEPGSSLRRGGVPQYIVYHELTEVGGRRRLGRATAVQPDWLASLGSALCRASKPLETPLPRYDPDADDVLCFVRVDYGKAAWRLPPQETSHPPGSDRARVFARALLEGKVLPELAPVLRALSGAPSSLSTPRWATQTRAVMLIRALTASNATTRRLLLQHHSQDPSFLHPELCAWVSPTHHATLRRILNNL